MKIYLLSYLLAIVTLALMAGLFYNWSFNIISGISKLDDRAYLNMMQILNKSILNPAFIFIFLGSIFGLPFLTFLQSKLGFNLSFWFIATAMIIYLLGSIGTTFFGNVPLNNQLEALNLVQLSEEECNSFRRVFEQRWNNLNYLRTFASFTSMVMLIIPLLMKMNK